MLSAKNKRLVGETHTQLERAMQKMEQLPTEGRDSRAEGLSEDEDRYLTAASLMMGQAAEILELLHQGAMRKLHEVASPATVDRFIKSRGVR